MEMDISGLIAELCGSVQDAQFVLEAYSVEKYFNMFNEATALPALEPIALNISIPDGRSVSVPLMTLVPNGSLSLNGVRIQMNTSFRFTDGCLTMEAREKTSEKRVSTEMDMLITKRPAAAGVLKLVQIAASLI